MINEAFLIALKNLKKRKARSILTFVGIFLSILTIFVLMSLSLGLNQVVQEQFELLGGDKLFVQAKGALTGVGTDNPITLTMDDVGVIEKLNEIKTVSYFTVENAKIEFKDKDPARYFYITGMPTAESDLMELMFEASDIDVSDGRFLKKSDRNKIMVGSQYARNQLFSRNLRVGDTLKLNDVEFEIIGIVEPIGNPSDDQNIYMGLEYDFKNLFGTGGRVDYIMIQIKPGEDILRVADKVERKLIKARGLTEKTADFTVIAPEELLESFGNILGILTFFLIGIGGISVVVGGIGIANTMYTSVLERRKEIGTMKAVGARNSDILLIFVIESGVLGLVGGILGLLAGIGIAKTVEYIVALYLGASTLLRASMHPGLILGSLAFAFLVGVVSGLLPSYQASNLKPADALRYE